MYNDIDCMNILNMLIATHERSARPALSLSLSLSAI